MMTNIVIVAYRAKPGCIEALLDLTRDHVPLLRRLGLATDRPPIVMQNRDGVIVEVFEWADGGIDRAHQHPDVHALWQRYAEVCDYVPLNTLPETTDMFATFAPVAALPARP
jgi:hypothetical protein